MEKGESQGVLEGYGKPVQKRTSERVVKVKVIVAEALKKPRLEKLIRSINPLGDPKRIEERLHTSYERVKDEMSGEGSSED